MSVYTELLKLALSQTRAEPGSVGELVTRALSARPAAGAASVDHVADWLAYDVLLVRLCDRLEVSHGMLDPHAGPVSRVQAETGVSHKLPLYSQAIQIGELPPRGTGQPAQKGASRSASASPWRTPAS